MKSLEEARRHLEESVLTIPARYESGVGRGEWRKPAIDGEELFKSEMSKVIAEGRRKKAIEKLTDEDWREPSIRKGVPVIGERIRGALDDYEKNFGPVYAEVGKAVKTLKPKTPDFKTNILNRVTPVVEAMKKASGKL